MTTATFEVVSGEEIADMDIPEPEYLWELLIRAHSKVALIGQEKVGKSFFAMQLGMAIAAGQPFLGYPTRQAGVLYVNLEIYEGDFFRRVKDMRERRAWDLRHFYAYSLAGQPLNIALDTPGGWDTYASLLQGARAKDSSIGLLILDPRIYTMQGKEEESTFLRRWCVGVDRLIEEFGVAVLVVHHKGKSTTGAGRGSSVFDGWLDTIMWLEPEAPFSSFGGGVNAPDLTKTRLDVKARSEAAPDLTIAFNYPLWELAPGEWPKMQGRVAKAKDFILQRLKDGETKRQELMEAALGSDIKDSTFKQAQRELEDMAQIKAVSIPPGNTKLLRLVAEPVAA